MEWLAVPILWHHELVLSPRRNYGVAIILLTVLTKVLFFPLTVKSDALDEGDAGASAADQCAPDPSTRAIRSACSARRWSSTAQHKVNPLGGCLPMVAQIPIFYALYVALSVSVELQNASFICFGHLFGIHLWICDLARQDPTYMLPILMGVSMFVQQKMTPMMGDPRQAKMMLLMPVVFTFMFLNLPRVSCCTGRSPTCSRSSSRSSWIAPKPAPRTRRGSSPTRTERR